MGGQRLEHIRAAAQVVEVVVGEGAEGVGFGAVFAEDLNQFLTRAWPWCEQQRIHQAEHRGVGPDAQRQDDHGQGGIAGITGKESESEAEILEQAGHGCL